MPTVVDIGKTDDPRDVVHRAVHLLSEGEVVGLPTETVYVVAAHALVSEGVSKIRKITEEKNLGRPILGVGSAAEAWDYVPHTSSMGRKMTRRCWPGPVTLLFDVSEEEGLEKSLPTETRELVAKDGELGLRVPAHDLVLEILRLMPAPLVFSSEVRENTASATRAEELVEFCGDEVSLIIDDGGTRYGQPSTIVRIQDDDWEIVRSGVVNETILRRLTSEVYLFVCTGNTCRSPMAEGIFRKLLSEKLQCEEDELVDRGFVVSSAGMSAPVGAPASPEGVTLLTKRGIDIGNHESQPLTNRLLDQADYIFTMTCGHRESILARRPDLADRVKLLAGDESDISDPIGGSLADYEKCSEEIERHIRSILSGIEVNKD